MDLLGAAGTGDEEKDAKDVATLLHTENLGHPRADPFEMLGGLDDPDKSDLAGGVGSVRVTGDEIADVRNLVGDTNTGGEKHDSAVRCEALRAVGTLDERSASELATRGHLSLLEEGVGETSTAANDQRHVGATGTKSVLTGYGKSLLGAPVFLLLAPCEGERVAGDATDGRHVKVDVGTGSELPGLGNTKGDSDGVTGESLNLSLGTTVASVAADDGHETPSALDEPADSGGHDVALLPHAFAVHPDTNDSSNGQEEVNAEESLVPGVADDRGREEQEQNEGSSADHTGLNQLAGSQGDLDDGPTAIPTLLVGLRAHPDGRVGNGFQDDDAAEPAVNEVVRVKAEAEEEDERVVAASQKEQRNHVHDGKNTSPVTGVIVPELRVAPFDGDAAEGDLHGKVADEEEELKTARKDTHVGSGRELELAVVSLLPEGCRDEVTLDLGVGVIGNAEVSLFAVARSAVVEVGKSADVTEEDESPSVDEHSTDNGDPGPGGISHDLCVLLLGDGFVGNLRRGLDWRSGHGVRDRCEQRQRDGGRHCGGSCALESAVSGVETADSRSRVVERSAETPYSVCRAERCVPEG